VTETPKAASNFDCKVLRCCAHRPCCSVCAQPRKDAVELPRDVQDELDALRAFRAALAAGRGGPPMFEAKLIELRHGDGWTSARFDCTPPDALRDDPVLERIWDNPDDEVFDDQR